MEVVKDQKYTVGFIFNADLQKVLLIHKEKPDWQKGRVNAVGGKYESGESPAACIRRETREETTLEIPEDAWVYVGAIHQKQGDVGILATIFNGNLEDAVSNEEEQIEWFSVNELPLNVMDNVHWLIPLSLDKLRTSDTFSSFSVTYS